MPKKYNQINSSRVSTNTFLKRILKKVSKRKNLELVTACTCMRAEAVHMAEISQGSKEEEDFFETLEYLQFHQNLNCANHNCFLKILCGEKHKKDMLEHIQNRINTHDDILEEEKKLRLKKSQLIEELENLECDLEENEDLRADAKTDFGYSRLEYKNSGLFDGAIEALLLSVKGQFQHSLRNHDLRYCQSATACRLVPSS